VPVSTDAYRTLAERLRELESHVFSPHEAQQIRDAADARLFDDDDQIALVRRVLALLDELVEAVRLSRRTCRELGDLLCEIEPVGRGS
jgi:hypothetical protein